MNSNNFFNRTRCDGGAVFGIGDPRRLKPWLMNRREDGTFTIEFRTVKAGSRLPIQTEEGRWKYQDGRYTTITTIVKGKAVDPHYVDEYELKSLSENEMTYYHLGIKQTFSSKRVGCDYQAP